MAGAWHRPQRASLRQPGLAQAVVVPLDESVEFRVIGGLGPQSFLLFREREAGLELLEDSQSRTRLGLPTEECESTCLQGEGVGELWIRRSRALAFLEGFEVVTQHHIGQADP